MVLSKGNKTTSTFPLFTTKTWVGCIFTTDVNFLLENIKMFWRVFFFLSEQRLAQTAVLCPVCTCCSRRSWVAPLPSGRFYLCRG